MTDELRKKTAGTIPPTESSGGIEDKIASAQSPSIRVFLALENRLLREILARVLRRHTGLELAGQNGPGELTAEEITRTECDVLLLDFIDPEWLLSKRVQNEAGKKLVQIVAIGMDSDQEKFLEAVACGVTGYLLKDASSPDIVAAVRAAASGQAVCPSQLCTLLFKEVAQIQRKRHVEKQRASTRLTLRQQNLMKLAVISHSLA
jgi:DNA-binding NarL/FixJ family response regulator